MKRHVLWHFVRLGALTALLMMARPAGADPILPYSDPIAGQLSNDIAILEANPNRTPAENSELSKDRSALAAYHRASSTLATDILILRNLDQILADSAPYSPLITDSIEGYHDDFVQKEEALRMQLFAAARSGVKSNTMASLNFISNKLDTAAQSISNPPIAIGALQKAAQRFPSASNGVHRALGVALKNSLVVAKIGRLDFVAAAKATTGTLTNGILDIWTTNFPVDVRRQFHLQATEVGTNAPVTYPLSPGLLYYAKFKTNVYEFTNQTGTITVQAFRSGFALGVFQFTAGTQMVITKGDTNTIATVTNGEFQVKLE